MKAKVVSIIVPVYNEEYFISTILEKVLKHKVGGLKKQIIVVNDGSEDGTAQILERFKTKGVLVITLPQNSGKGSAIRAALPLVKGDIVIIQDADLEYDPLDYQVLLGPLLDGRADVVFGSRFGAGGPHRVLYFWHYLGNQILTLLSNMLTNLNLTDTETGYKAFTVQIARKLDLQEKRFGFELEFTAKVAKLKARIFEVGISYAGRTYAEGKKINWLDGVSALRCILRYNLESEETWPK